jgi:hypothetical protein
LADFSDGDLSDAEARWVAAHLGECPECRSELRMLERSLELARSIWQEDAARGVLDQRAETHLLRLGEGWGEGFVAGTRDAGRTRAAIRLVACVAAVLLLAAGAWWLWPARPGGESDRPELAGPLERPASEPVSPARQSSTKGSPVTAPDRSPDDPASEDPDVEALIARAGRAARLAASAELLAVQPGLEQYRAQADRYLAEAYRGTPAGDRAARRVGPRTNEAN